MLKYLLLILPFLGIGQDNNHWDSIKVSTTFEFDSLKITLDHPKGWKFEKHNNGTYYAYFDNQKAFMFVSANYSGKTVSKEDVQELSVSEDNKSENDVNFECGYYEIDGNPSINEVAIKTNHNPKNGFYGFSQYTVFIENAYFNFGWQTTETSKKEVVELFKNTFPYFKLSANSASIN